MDVNRNGRIILIFKKIEKKSVAERTELVASIGLLKIILQLITMSPSINLDDGFDLDDGFETASCRQTKNAFEIFRSFLEINKESIVDLKPRF